MQDFKKPDEQEIERINRVQQRVFSELYRLFDPPLPEGVPGRLERIVAAAGIAEGEAVLDVGSGTGILIPLIQAYAPGQIYACDLSAKMLEQLRAHYPGVDTILADVRDLALPDGAVGVVFINACYPNIVDKAGAFANIARMMKPAGRMIVSHPMGKAFIDSLRKEAPFPLDRFPEESEARTLFAPYGFDIDDFVDEPNLYILKAIRKR